MKRIQYRIASAAEFTAKNPVLARDEIGIERDTGKEKIGDGSTAWTGLAYFADTATDPTKVGLTGNDTISGTKTFTGSVVLPAATSIGPIDSTELGHLEGVTGAIQTQLNGKAASVHGHPISDVTNLQTTLDGKVDEVASTDNAIARFDGTTGALQNSGVTVDNSNNVTVPGNAYVNGTASVDPYLHVQSQDGRTPYLVLKSVGTQDVYQGWVRGNTTRFYMRCTQDDWTIRSADDTGNIWGSAPYGSVFRIDRTTGKVTLGGHTTGAYTAGLEFGSSGPRIMVGTGGPSGISAPVGSTWRQTDANSSHGSLTGLLWTKVGTGTTEGTDWLVDYEGRWVSYTPTWTNVSMSATDARYTIQGKTCSLMLRGTLSAAPSGAVTVTLPSAASIASYHQAGPVRLIRNSTYNGVWLRESSSSLLIRYWNASNVATNLSATLPDAWVSGDWIVVTATYEIA